MAVLPGLMSGSCDGEVVSHCSFCSFYKRQVCWVKVTSLTGKTLRRDKACDFKMWRVATVYLYENVFINSDDNGRGRLWWLSGEESTCQCRRHRFDAWVGKIPWRRKWQPTPVFLLGKSHGQGSLVGWGPGESEVAQLCLTLCDPTGCGLPGSSVHGIFQASILGWVPISFSRGSSRPKGRTWVSHIASRLFTVWATRWSQAVVQGIPKCQTWLGS